MVLLLGVSILLLLYQQATKKHERQVEISVIEEIARLGLNT